MKKHLPLIAVVLIMLLVVWPARLYYMGGKFFAEGQKCEEKGDRWTAALWYGDSAKTWFPLNPYVKKSHDRLSNLAETLEKEGNYEEALHVQRELLASLYAVQSFIKSNSELIPDVEASIKSLVKLKQEQKKNAP